MIDREGKWEKETYDGFLLRICINELLFIIIIYIIIIEIYII